MRSYSAFLLSVTLLTLPLGCGSPHASAPPDTGPVSVEGWDGVNNLFRDGRMYFGGQPDEASLVRFATEAGVKTVINLRYPEEMGRVAFDEPSVVDSLGMRYVTIPVSPDTFSESDVARLAEVLSSTEEPVLLHCASSNRVGGVWAAYLAKHEGVAVEEAIELGRLAGLRSESMESATRRVAGE